MLDRIISGKSELGYNVLCLYAKARASSDPRIGSVMPRDYTLVMSRIAFISRYAPHPDEAEQWLDYVLSKRGQTILNRSPALGAQRRRRRFVGGVVAPAAGPGVSSGSFSTPAC